MGFIYGIESNFSTKTSFPTSWLRQQSANMFLFKYGSWEALEGCRRLLEGVKKQFAHQARGTGRLIKMPAFELIKTTY